MEQNEKRAEVCLNGQIYPMELNLGALEDIQKEFGGMKEAFSKMGEGNAVGTVRTLFRILANAYREVHGMPTDVTGDEIKRNMSVPEFMSITEAIRQAVANGMKSETTGGGPADDSPRDPIKAEHEAKNV